MSAERSRRWLYAHFELGLLVGLIVGLLCHAIVAAREGLPAFGILVAGVLFSGAELGVVAAFAGVATAPLSHRRGAAVASVVVLVAAGAIRLFAANFRRVSGAFPESVVAQAVLVDVRGYARESLHGSLPRVLAALFFLVVSTALLVRVVRRRTDVERAVPPRRRTLASVLGLLSTLTIFVTLKPTTRALAELRRAIPETAFFDSRAPTIGAPYFDGPVVDVPPGPALDAGDAWRRTVLASHGPRPNVLLVVIDSVPWDHLGATGYPRKVTPNLDRLSERSMRMRRAWTTAVHSNYAQMALISSLYPRRGDVLDMYGRLDYPRVLFHDVFAAAGYETATISSQDENWQGMRRFEETPARNFFFDRNDHHGEIVALGATDSAIPDRITTDRAIAWMDADADADADAKHDRPWALYLNFQGAHFPYALPAGYVGAFQPSQLDPVRCHYLACAPEQHEALKNRYDNALTYVDLQIGRITAFLESKNLANDTIIVVTSDHGEMFGEHGIVTHGKSLHEGQVHVPLLVAWPGHVTPADRDDAVSHLDVLPTLLDLLELPPHPAHQGKSFRAPLGPRHAVFMTGQGLRRVDGVTCWPWKLVVDHSDQRILLHRLDLDPREEHDVIDEQQEIAKSLATLLRSQIKANLQYHADMEAMKSRYAPRMLDCPDLTLPAPAPLASAAAAGPR